MRRASALAAVALAAAAFAWLKRPQGNVDRVAGWLGDHCASVVRSEQHSSLPGVVVDHQLECQMLGGTIDVVRFRSAAARSAALERANGDVCLLGRDGAMLNGLLWDADADFRRWCGQLDGRSANSP